jgi:hypothetical protein
MFDPRLEFCVPGAPPCIAERRVKDQRTGHTVVRRFIERTNDPLRQVFTERFRIDELDDQGRSLDSEETSWTFRWNTRQEMRYLFELTGFEVVTEYSDFFRSPPAYGAEQLWVVRKIEGIS